MVLSTRVCSSIQYYIPLHVASWIVQQPAPGYFCLAAHSTCMKRSSRFVQTCAHWRYLLDSCGPDGTQDTLVQSVCCGSQLLVNAKACRFTIIANKPICSSKLNAHKSVLFVYEIPARVCLLHPHSWFAPVGTAGCLITITWDCGSSQHSNLRTWQALLLPHWGSPSQPCTKQQHITTTTISLQRNHSKRCHKWDTHRPNLM